MHPFPVRSFVVKPNTSPYVSFPFDLPKNNFQLVDGADRLLTKFETFLEKDDLAEQVLFNLICFNPNVVRYCGDMDELGEEFCYVVNEIFNVREFLDTKLQ